MRRWLESLTLPWAHIPRRWRVALMIAAMAERVITSANIAVREWWPSTCRPETLTAWGRTLRRPRRDGESASAHRARVATWRSEPVGQSGWVRSEMARITGTPRVIEFPRDGMRCGHDRCGRARAGRGPKLILGVAPEHRAEVAAMVDEGVPRDAAVVVHPPAEFDEIR